MKVVIVGGGVIGLMQARELAQAGCEVCLIDKGECGREASWAGGGIVSPLYPWRYSQPVTDLASWSQAYYPNLCESLEAESDVDPQLSRHGLLMLSVEDEAEALEWARDNNRWLEQVDGERIRSLEPSLRADFEHALWMSQVASVRNPRLVRALKTSLEREPRVEIRETCPMTGVVMSGGRVAAVETPEGRIDCDQLLICSGAWSAGLAQQFGLQLPVQPVKGQMILFAAKPGLVNRVVLKDGTYLIPRRDGNIVVGSTLEHTEFNKETTEDARCRLEDFAIDLYPQLADCQVTAHWAGLRPGSPDGVPFIGQVPGVDGVWINAGHYRNGLLLAPGAVRLLTALLTDQELPLEAAPYDPAGRLTPCSTSSSDSAVLEN